MFSIDQNSHSLWDALPKVQALAGKGIAVRHFVEDVDTAFTAMGAGVGGKLSLARERFYRSGGADWGAALFYTEFFGRQAVDIRQWEIYTGLATAALAKKLDVSVAALFDEFSPGDNWQLIGPSYVQDYDHHRVIADLSVAETAEFLRQILLIAQQDMLKAFPASASQQRVREFFTQESARVDALIAKHAGGPLVNVYQDWMGQYAPTVQVGLASTLFALGDDPLLRLFLGDYGRLAALYNEALRESHVGLNSLDVQIGELPFFAVRPFQGHCVRVGMYCRDGRLIVGEDEFRIGESLLDDLARAGVTCICGKAVVLVIQARLGAGRSGLALPYRGSIYLGASHRFVVKLQQNALLGEPLHPIVRVRLRFLDRLSEVDSVIRLPAYLADAAGKSEMPAREFSQIWHELAHSAQQELQAFRQAGGMEKWQQSALPDLWRKDQQLSLRRREMAKQDPKSAAIRELWQENRAVQVEMLWAAIRHIARQEQVANLDYWDSRGAIYPWALALSGEDFYRSVLQQAEVYEEGPEAEPATLERLP